MARRDFDPFVSPQGLEPLTEGLIRELVARGWPERDLRWAVTRNFRYSRVRDSLVSGMGFNVWPFSPRRRRR